MTAAGVPRDVTGLLACIPGPREPVGSVSAWLAAAVARLDAVAAASGDACLTADALALAAAVRSAARGRACSVRWG